MFGMYPYRFNKLVLESAYNKLFVSPQVREYESFVAVLKLVARACTGNVYVALIHHSAKWKDAKHHEFNYGH